MIIYFNLTETELEALDKLAYINNISLNQQIKNMIQAENMALYSLNRAEAGHEENDREWMLPLYMFARLDFNRDHSEIAEQLTRILRAIFWHKKRATGNVMVWLENMQKLIIEGFPEYYEEIIENCEDLGKNQRELS